MRGYITHGVIIALAILAIGGSWLATRVQDEPEAETFGVAPRVLTVIQGGTGTSTVPNTGEVLVGLSDGTYKPTATSSLGITSSLPTITISGDVDGTGTTSIVTTVDNDSHDHTGLTLSGIDISDDTNLSGDTEVVLTGDALSLGNTLSFSYASTTGISGTNLNFTNATSSSSFFSALGTFTNSVINTLLTAVSGIFTTSLQVPNGTAPTVDATGEIALDTTDNQLLVGTSTTGLNVVRTKEEIYKFSVPSTSPAFATGTVKYLPRLSDGYIIDEVWCGVEGGTNKIINILGSNLTCTTAGATITPSITTITAGSSTVAYTASTTSGVVNWLNVTITGRYTRE